ncbi:hypothetical protein [Niallia sp. Krafla_26]
MSKQGIHSRQTIERLAAIISIGWTSFKTEVNVSFTMMRRAD